MFIYIFNTTLNALACFYCSRNCDLDIAKASWHAIYRIHDRQILQNFQLKKKLQKIETFSIKNISMGWYEILSEMKMHKAVFVSPESWSLLSSVKTENFYR